ncbi:hypothetical protein [Streptomyces sp. NPDC048473]|uniref:hypothetical protein n=1 Tax=unclassified Streptomyces TaxID=2593676 RepID=UPI0037118D4B
MNDETRLRIRHTFDRLSAGGRALTDIDRALMEAFERLMHGLPELTDGKITVVNLLEAPQTRGPEPEELASGGIPAEEGRNVSSAASTLPDPGAEGHRGHLRQPDPGPDLAQRQTGGAQRPPPRTAASFGRERRSPAGSDPSVASDLVHHLRFAPPSTV